MELYIQALREARPHRAPNSQKLDESPRAVPDPPSLEFYDIGSCDIRAWKMLSRDAG
jgi:hypothetical protein